MTSPATDRLDPRDRVLVIGKTGSGKSTWAKRLVLAELERRARVVAFDPHDEYSVHGRKSDHVRLGPLRQRVTMAELVLDPAEHLDRDDLSLSVVPGRTRQEIAVDFRELCSILRSTGNLVFVAEELGTYGDLATNEIEDCACQFRHEGIPVVLVAQCAVQVPKIARRQASRVVSGRQDDPDDLTALEKVCGETFASRVSCLGVGELVEWRDTFTRQTEGHAS